MAGVAFRVHYVPYDVDNVRKGGSAKVIFVHFGTGNVGHFIVGNGMRERFLVENFGDTIPVRR